MSVTYKLLNKGNPGTATKVASDDWDLVIKAFTGQASGIPAWIFRSTNKIGFADNVFWIESSANSKKINFRSSANTIDVNLFIPLLDDADNNLIIDTVANTLKERNIFEKDIDFKTTAQPATPGAGHVRLYLDTADSKLKFINSSGTIFDLTALGAADTKVIVQEAGSQVGSIARKLNFLTATDFNVTEDAPNDRINIEIADNAIGNSEIATHSSTKISIAASSQLPANVALEDTANNFLETITITKNAQAAVGEVLLHMAVSDDAVGYARFYNTTTTNAILSPALDIKSGSSTASCFILAQTTVANDVGTTPVLIIDIRQDDNTPVTTRPLLTFRNSSGVAFLQFNASNQIDISPAWATNQIFLNNMAIYMRDSGGNSRIINKLYNSDVLQIGDQGLVSIDVYSGSATRALNISNTNQFTFTKLAQTGVAETLARWSVSDNAGSYLELVNAQSVDGQFAPLLQSVVDASVANTMPSFYLRTHITTDTGTTAATLFDARMLGGSQIATRPLFVFRNFGTEVLKINAKGDTLQTAIAQTGVRELCARWCVSDDPQASIYIENNSATDGIFSPRIVSLLSANAIATDASLRFLNYIQPAVDSGTTAVVLFDARRTGDVAVTTRPLFDFMSANVSFLRINAKGDILQTAIAQTGVGEICHTWTTGDDTSSSLQVLNYTNVDGQFAPFIIGNVSTNVATNIPAFGIRANIPVVSDVGTVPLFLLESRLVGQDVAIRPLFQFKNRNTAVMTISAKGAITHSIIAEAGVAELLASWMINDNATAYFQITNASSTDAIFVPRIKTYNYGAGSSNVGFLITNYVGPTEDSGTTPVAVWDVRLGNDTAFATRDPLWRFRNAGTTLIDIGKNGRITQTYQDEGLEEIFQKITLSDGGNSYFNIGNALGGLASSFAPRIWGHNDLASVSYSGLYIYGSIATGQDSALVGAISLDGRIGSAGALVNRPMVTIRNSSTIVYSFFPSKVDLGGKLLTNVYGVQQEPTQRFASILFTPASLTEPKGSGVFNTGFNWTGTATSGNDSSGGFNRILCASSVDALANMLPLGSHTVRGSNPKWQMHVNLDSVTAVRLKFGLSTANSAAGTTCIPTNQAGIMFRFFAGTDTNWQIVSNDALGGAEEVMDTGFAGPSTGTYILELYYNGTNWLWAIYNVSGTTLASGTVTNTQLPGSTHAVAVRCQMENIDGAASKSWYTRWIKLYKNGYGPALPYN